MTGDSRFRIASCVAIGLTHFQQSFLISHYFNALNSLQIETGNRWHFTAHLMGANVDVNDLKPKSRSNVCQFPLTDRDNRFALILHPLTVGDYANIDPSLSVLSDQQISRLAECVAENFDPFVVGDAHIVSKTGQAAYGEFIIVPRTAGELAQMPYYDAMSEIRAAARTA